MSKKLQVPVDQATEDKIENRARKNFRSKAAEARFIIEVGLRSLDAEACGQADELRAALQGATV